MTAFQNILVFATLSIYSFVSGRIYSTCYVNETYCLFSFGPNVTVNNVSEAQTICEDAKHGSWLLEIVDERTLKNVNEFLFNHSFPEDTGLILNAEKVGNEWRWIKNKSENSFIPLRNNGNVKYYVKKEGQKDNDIKQFSIICMTDCPFKFDIHEGKRYIYATHHKNKSTDECKKVCEYSKCEAFEWESVEGEDYGCWIHETLSGSMSENPKGTLFIRNMSLRTSDCVGNLKEPILTKSNQEPIIDYTFHIILSLVLSLIAALFVIGLIFWRKLKNSHQSNVSQNPNSVGIPRSQFSSASSKAVNQNLDNPPVIYGVAILEGSNQEKSSPSHKEICQTNTSNNGLVYADLLLTSTDKNSNPKKLIIGPMGDVYAQVNRR